MLEIVYDWRSLYAQHTLEKLGLIALLCQASHFPVLHMCKKCHRIFYVKTCAAGQIECEKTCAAGKTYQTKCAAGRILDEVLIGTLSY